VAIDWPRGAWIAGIGLAAQLTGLTLITLHLLGWFGHESRIELLQRLERGGEPTTEIRAARELLQAFGMTNAFNGAAPPVRLFVESRPGKDGNEVRRVHLARPDGTSELVASFEEVGWWALEANDGWAWLGLGLSSAATVVGWALRPGRPGSRGRGGASGPPT